MQGTVLGNVRTQNATAYICNRNGDRKGDGDIIATGDRLVIMIIQVMNMLLTHLLSMEISMAMVRLTL